MSRSVFSSLCGRSGSSDGSVFVASWSGTCFFFFFFFFFFFSEIIGPAAARPAGPAPAPLLELNVRVRLRRRSSLPS